MPAGRNEDTVGWVLFQLVTNKTNKTKAGHGGVELQHLHWEHGRMAPFIFFGFLFSLGAICCSYSRENKRCRWGTSRQPLQGFACYYCFNALLRCSRAVYSGWERCHVRFHKIRSYMKSLMPAILQHPARDCQHVLRCSSTVPVSIIMRLVTCSFSASSAGVVGRELPSHARF